MKKTFFVVLTLTLFTVIKTEAQTLQEGINHLYADRYKNAEKVFKQILAVNPNVIEATYWLGQTYLDMDDNDAARQLYDKALMANGNAPLLMVGKGHVHLLDKKKDDARQLFESALTISRTKKGDDPVILNAIGRANVDAKEGNFQYAIEVLEQALLRDPKSADIALNLGNAYRKANPGQGGGKAYEFYKKALELNPNFVYAYIRIAKLFETQGNWELVLTNLNDAIAKDQNFSPAYYELFYYYFFKADYNQSDVEFKKWEDSRPGEDLVEQNYINSQLCWAKKDFDCAISKAESVKTAMGGKVKPKVFRQLAYSYSGKGDYGNAKKNIDEFFLKSKDGPIPADYILKAEIYAGAGVPCEELYGVYLTGANLDSVLQSKIEYLNKAADYFKTKKCTKQEADMRMLVFNIRKNPNPASLVNIGILYSQSGELIKADSLFAVYSVAFPDSIYGYSWRGRVNFTIDTSMTVEPYISTMLLNYQKTLDIAMTDKNRFKSMGTNAAMILAGYFNNIRSSRDTSLSYILKGLEIDSTNVQLKSIKEIFDKQMAPKQPKTPSKSNNKPVSAIRKPQIKDSITTT